MSKNPKTVPVNLAALDTEEVKLKAKLAEIAQKRENATKAENERIKETVNSFMEQLSTETKPVNSLAEVIAIIKAVEKGTIGSVAGAKRTYVVLTKEQEASATERLKAGEQVSVIAADLKCSEGKIWSLKTAAGLTTKRETTAKA